MLFSPMLRRGTSIVPPALCCNHLFYSPIAIRLPREAVHNSRATANCLAAVSKYRHPGRPSRLRADSDVPEGSRFAAETYGIQVASLPVGVTQMMKEHFGMSVCRTVAILSALLCGQGQAILFAQQ